MLEIDDWCKLFTSIYSANKKTATYKVAVKMTSKGTSNVNFEEGACL